jgi:hypothetical protein
MALNDRKFSSLVEHNKTATENNISTAYAQVGAGQYNTVLPTLANGDYGFLQMTSDGKLYVQNSSDIELGAVEIKDGTTDVRLDVITQDDAFGTATNGLAVFGKYQVAPTTYTDGDAAPILLDANGRIVLSSDIEIGAVELKNGATDDRALISVANTGRAVTDMVLQVQTTAADGTVPPSGSLVSNAPFTTITDGTNTMPTMDVVGRAGYSYITDGTNTANTMDVAARAGYQYITDGTNTMPTMDVVARKGFVAITDGTSTVDIGIDESSMAATPEFLPIGGEYRAADTTYTDGDASILQTNVNGHLKVVADGYDTATDSMKVFEVAPLNTAYVSETLLALTNIAAATTAYAYIDMNGYRYLTIQAETDGTTPTDVLTVTVEGTCQDDGTAAASCTYQDVTTTLFGVASWVDTDFHAIIDTPVAFKYLRIKYNTSNTGGSDCDLTVYTKKMF